MTNYVWRLLYREKSKDEDMELLQYAQQLSNAEVPETIRQSILAERARKTATGVKVVYKLCETVLVSCI